MVCVKRQQGASSAAQAWGAGLSQKLRCSRMMPNLRSCRLDELMEADCKSEVFEVQEKFAIGLFADVHRAADEVSGCMQAQLRAQCTARERVSTSLPSTTTPCCGQD